MGDFAVYLDRITEQVRAAVPDAAAKGAEHIRQLAAERAPKETGHMAAESEVKVHEDGAEVYFPGPYARYQEFGISRFSGRPLRHENGQSFYLVTAYEEGQAQAVQIIAEELRKAIED